MKKRINSLFISLVILVGIIIANIAIFKSNYNNKNLTLGLLKETVMAAGECGVGESQTWTQPKAGNFCVCNDQIVMSQTCEPNITGNCSPISCY